MKQTEERAQLLSAIDSVSAEAFEALALAVFRYQASNNHLYQRFLALLGKSAHNIQHAAAIPFLPIQFFKTQTVISGNWTPETHFSSSATTGQTPSRHLVRNMDWYLQNCLKGFTAAYGDPAEYRIFALLPSYLEREGSSLVAMADNFIQRSKYPESNFFLHNHQALAGQLQNNPAKAPTLLLGVSFALLDFAESAPVPLTNTIVMDTGGMKGRRKEMTREELHGILKTAFQQKNIHSEYGMTELFSQAYSRQDGRFYPAPSLRVFSAEINDPLQINLPGKTGALCFIDLANIDTCSFIATEDVGRVFEDGSFEVLGRLDAAEMRGCNLMVE